MRLQITVVFMYCLGQIYRACPFSTELESFNQGPRLAPFDPCRISRARFSRLIFFGSGHLRENVRGTAQVPLSQHPEVQ